MRNPVDNQLEFSGTESRCERSTVRPQPGNLRATRPPYIIVCQDHTHLPRNEAEVMVGR